MPSQTIPSQTIPSPASGGIEFFDPTFLDPDAWETQEAIRLCDMRRALMGRLAAVQAMLERSAQEELQTGVPLIRPEELAAAEMEISLLEEVIEDTEEAFSRLAVTELALQD